MVKEQAEARAALQRGAGRLCVRERPERVGLQAGGTPPRCEEEAPATARMMTCNTSTEEMVVDDPNENT
ncbi:Protein of unknown function [Gryllus bimaculatus]|nr:Protein of unknown function [Gryllus bimaculatus]